jgi:hypothetical protein
MHEQLSALLVNKDKQKNQLKDVEWQDRGRGRFF